MKKIIVTTTINQPTKATLKFCEITEQKDWEFIIVGDLKTPHDDYIDLQNKFKKVHYYPPKKQEELFPNLSNILGWNTIQRRNIGFLIAYKNNVDILATIDDDNIPYDFWGDDLNVGKQVTVDLYKNTSCDYFDSFSITNHKHLWHRGYPIDYLDKKNDIEYLGKKTFIPLVQADFWDGDPDIDAICRLSNKPIVKFDKFNSFTVNQLTPFNSQNTFIHREVLKKYSVLPYIGRMDDIWGSYIIQKYFPNSVLFNKSSVYQERNPQDLITNLEKEILGYRKTKEFISNLDNYENYLPTETLNFYKQYKNEFK